ncbi:Vacuolar amino acid transporter 1 [Rhodotorula toruloides]|nr:Vacuolar amino acid transporter 1 [Rhodotorula toruloides]
MTSRRIPIQQPQRPAQTQNTGFKSSSLDAVFSFQRSAQFFGENLPSAASFVDPSRYPRPPEDWSSGDEDEEDDGDEEEAVGGRGRRTRRREMSETTEDDEESEVTDGHEPSSSEAWHSTHDGTEQLPPNAVVRGGGSRRASAAGWNGAASPATERSPLLAASRPAAAAANGSYLSSGVDITEEPEQVVRRRPSTFSKEAWKAAIEEHRGESTWSQSLFNTVNVLIGVGLLADPLAFADSGWIFGTILLVFCCLVTNYTAKMLAAMMRQDRHSHTYADVLIRAYGGKYTPSLIYFLFLVELLTFSVATVELFADSMASLFPKVGALAFKLISYGILLPTTFLPLRILSLTSLIGIMSSFVLLAVLITDGAVKHDAPGSLVQVMPTSIWPRWKRFPLSFGLLMSGFSGHAVVPSLYRDMAHPQHFPSMINVAYIIAFSTSLVFAVLGYLMFGNDVSSEITRDLAKTAGYPVVLNKLAVWMVALNPLVKYAIANKPLVQTFEHLVGLHHHHAPSPIPQQAPPAPDPSDSVIATPNVSHLSPAISSAISSAPLTTPAEHAAHEAHQRRVRILRYTVFRPALTLLCIAAAIAIPEFDRVLAFLGSASAFVICVIGPVGAYLIVGKKREPGAPGMRKRRKSSVSAAAGGRYGALVAQVGSKPAVPSPLNSSFGQSDLERRRRSKAFEAGAADSERELVVEGAERALCWVLLVVSVLMATVGTVWSFLPVEEAGLQ